MTVRVQIKSKAGGKPTAKIKLSNALRFASEQDPCFIVLWWRTQDHSVERIYVRHFDEPLIEATLRRAREAQRDGINNLNKIILSVSFDDSNDHTHDVIAWIRSIGDTDQHEYSRWKRELTLNLGFDKSRIAGTLELPIDDLQKLIDAAVGLPTRPADVKFSLGNRRFDITSTTFEGRLKDSDISAVPRRGRLTFHNGAGLSAIFEGEVRMLAMEGMPVGTARATFKSPCISAVLRGQEFKIDYDFNANDAHPLDRMQNLARFMVMSAQSCNVALTLTDKNETVETQCPAVVIEDREIFAWLAYALDKLRDCCAADDNPSLRTMDVFAAQKEVENFAIAGAPGTPIFNLEIKQMANLPVVSNLVAFRLLSIGSVSFYTILRRACLEQSALGQKIRFRFNDPVELDAGVLTMEKNDARRFVVKRFRELANRVGTGALILNRGDYLSLMRREGLLVEVL